MSLEAFRADRSCDQVGSPRCHSSCKQFSSQIRRSARLAAARFCPAGGGPTARPRTQMDVRLVYSLTGVPLMRHAAIQYLTASPHHISRDVRESIASLHSRCWRWQAGLSDAALRWGSRY